MKAGTGYQPREQEPGVRVEHFEPKAKPGKAAGKPNGDARIDSPDHKSGDDEGGQRAGGVGWRRGAKLLPPLPHEPLFRSWEVIDAATLPPRDFIYGRHYIRGFACVTLAPGGGSKSSLIMVEAIAIATNRTLLGVRPKQRERVVYFNAEDPREEINRRVLAICQHFEIPQEELVGWLFVESGRDQDITLAYGIDGEINEPAFEMIQRFGEIYKPGVMNFDPLAAMTSSPETNEVFRAVGKRISKLANDANCAIGLAHHLRKLGGREAEIEDSRGGIALIDAARAGRVLNQMTKDEARNAGLVTHIDNFRVDGAGIGKVNLTRPSEHADWYLRVSVALPNGDHVAVIEQWRWPDPFAGITTADTVRVQRAIAARAEPPRENIQANEWVGKVVAATLGIDLDKRGERGRVKNMIKTWVEQDVLRVQRVEDADKKREIPVVVVGANRLDEADD